MYISVLLHPLQIPAVVLAAAVHQTAVLLTVTPVIALL